MFGYIVHTLRTDLYFHPLAFRSHYGGVQALVAVALGHAEPVAQTFGVGAIHISHDTVNLPAVLFLALGLGIQDDADGKQVVDAFKLTPLLLHLLPDGVDALRTSLDVELQSCSAQFFLNRGYKLADVLIARSLSGIELLFNHVESLCLQVF